MAERAAVGAEEADGEGERGEREEEEENELAPLDVEEAVEGVVAEQRDEKRRKMEATGERVADAASSI